MLERIRNLNKLLANRPDWYGTQPIREDSPENVVIMWEKALGIYKPPFMPTFRKVTGTDGQMTWPLPDTDYFATMETAQAMADKYGDGTVTEVDFGGTGGIFSVDAKEYHIAVNPASGIITLKNAGLIAAYYKRNPEDQFPGLADKLIKAILGL